MTLSGRFVRVFQWIAPVLLPVLIMFGRAFFGAPLGWMLVIGLFVAPIITIAMYIPPVIVVFDRDAAAARSTRVAYNIASWVTWVAMLVVMFTLVDGGDDGVAESVLSNWGLLSAAVTDVFFVIASIVALLGWVGTIATAIIGVVQSRSPGPRVLLSAP